MPTNRGSSPLGERLRLARKRNGLTQAALAHKLGVHPTTVRNWEAGRTQPWREVPLIERVLDVSLGADAYVPALDGSADDDVIEVALRGPTFANLTTAERDEIRAAAMASAWRRHREILVSRDARR